MLLQNKTPSNVAVKVETRSSGVVTVEAVAAKLGWKLIFEAGPAPGFATQPTGDAVLLGLAQFVTAHIAPEPKVAPVAKVAPPPPPPPPTKAPEAEPTPKPAPKAKKKGKK